MEKPKALPAATKPLVGITKPQVVKPIVKPEMKSTLPSSVKPSCALSGVNYTYHEMNLGEEFGKVNSDANIMIWGAPGSGKTYKLLKMAKDRADKGEKVLYIANEEYGKSTLDKKLIELGIHNGYKNITIVKHLPSDISMYNVIFFDSVNTLKLTPEMIADIDEKNPNKVFILIVQTNKDGSFRGGRDWEHLVDVAGDVVNRKLVLHKQRYDPDKVKHEAVEPKSKKAAALKPAAQKYEPESIIMKVA
jgi:hypothetical protein